MLTLKKSLDVIFVAKPYLFAVDPSLTCSGWALFSLNEKSPHAFGVFTPPGPKFALEFRLQTLQEEISSLFSDLSLGKGDYLVCEGPAPLVKNPQSSLKVERVRSIFETLAREREIKVPGRINPRTLQTELLGMRGQQLKRTEVKRWARDTVEKLYGANLNHLKTSGKLKKKIPQDIIDAILIGTIALSRIQISSQTGLPLTEAFEPKELKRSVAEIQRAGVSKH